MASRFRHEDVESVPKGWKVRTVKSGAHRVRVAFPPGRKQKGSGRLVSVLHPTSGSNPCSNPCSLRSQNPAELLIMGANPPRTKLARQRIARERASAIRMAASRNPAAKYEVVIVVDGREERHPFDTKEDAKRWAKQFGRHVKIEKIRQGRNPAELLVMGANPRVEVVHGDNPPVEEITEEFTGSEVKWLDVYNEPHIPRGRYAYLAKLMRLLIKPAKGGQVQKITFPEDSRPIIVSDSTGKQMYFVDGGQDMTPCLEAFTNESLGNDIVELGQAREIHYWGIKHHIGDEDTEEWRHKHGEEDGALPTVLFDTRNKRLLYEGGNYRIEGPWIHN
jgi:hypothetical protein